VVVNLLAILEDGTNPGLAVPISAAKAVIIPAGSDVAFNVTVVTRSGSPVSLQGGGTEVEMAVRKRPDFGYAFSPQPLVATNLQANTCVLTIPAIKTQNLPPGQYVYDVWLTKSGARNQVVPLSQLTLAPASVRG
jgi:hypothetical protein